jgi:hypothetical protein
MLQDADDGANKNARERGEHEAAQQAANSGSERQAQNKSVEYQPLSSWARLPRHKFQTFGLT